MSDSNGSTYIIKVFMAIAFLAFLVWMMGGSDFMTGILGINPYSYIR